MKKIFISILLFVLTGINQNLAMDQEDFLKKIYKNAQMQLCTMILKSGLAENIALYEFYESIKDPKYDISDCSCNLLKQYALAEAGPVLKEEQGITSNRDTHVVCHIPVGIRKAFKSRNFLVDAEKNELFKKIHEMLISKIETISLESDKPEVAIALHDLCEKIENDNYEIPRYSCVILDKYELWEGYDKDRWSDKNWCHVPKGLSKAFELEKISEAAKNTLLKKIYETHMSRIEKMSLENGGLANSVAIYDFYAGLEDANYHIPPYSCERLKKYELGSESGYASCYVHKRVREAFKKFKKDSKNKL